MQPSHVIETAASSLLADAASRATFEFEIYETGDPRSRAWDCSETLPQGTYFRGDISGVMGRTALIRHLRATYRGCLIRFRGSGRLVP